VARQVWDVIEDQEAVDLVRAIDDPREASNVLVRRSLEKGSMDNITAMVIRFRGLSEKYDGEATAQSQSTVQQGRIEDLPTVQV